jgi:dihydrofolate reductase
MMRKLILYIATSLDGYIAKPGDDLSFLSRVEKQGEDYGYNEFIKTVDTMILGRRTYDWVMNQVPKFPNADMETYVITRTERPIEGNIHFYGGDLKELVENLKRKPGKNIFCNGGAGLVNSLLEDGLIDEFIISVIPVLVGDGLKLFRDGRPEQELEFLEARTFDTGLVQMHFKKTPS